MVMVMTLYSSNASAKLFGLGVTFKKGTKEWNATKTAADCIGKGLCELVITFDPPLGYYQSGDNVNGLVGNDENGNFGIAFPIEILKDRFWSDTFTGGFLFIGSNIAISNEIKSKVKNCPDLIKSGSYSYRVADGQVIVLF